MKVKILQWHGVASWTWDAQDETCGICRMAFDGCCPDCKLPGDDCPLIWGACNHAFHLHCILKWVNSQTSQAHCPMCRREWQFKGWGLFLILSLSLSRTHVNKQAFKQSTVTFFFNFWELSVIMVMFNCSMRHLMTSTSYIYILVEQKDKDG